MLRDHHHPPATAPNSSRPTPGTRARRSTMGWRRATARAAKGLVRYRRTLRVAAPRVADRRFAHRLRRLSRRGWANAAMLRRAIPQWARAGAGVAPDPARPRGGHVDERAWMDPGPTGLAQASEIGALAVCIRANRAVRAAVDEALRLDPPASVATRLRRVHDRIGREFRTIDARLRQLSIAIDVSSGGGR